ncbi:MAG: histone deacetylase [Bdellovibrionia bacterium]
MITAYYDPRFQAPLGHHIMPIQKFGLVAQALSQDPDIQILSPSPITEEDLLRIHDPAYVRAVRTGEPRALAESQKFPWSPELFASVLMTNGAVLAAARRAIQEGAAAALASGFHHAGPMRGEGFCTFNGLILALEILRSEHQIQRAAILDLDLHYGNGTAQFVETRNWIQALSIYGNDYWENQAYRDVSVLQHRDGIHHQSRALPAQCDGPTQLRILEESFDFLLKNGKPDLLLYQAGADPFYQDPYSPLALTHEDLLERDRVVFEFTRAHQIPVAWVLAGGYTPDLSQVVKVHTNTFLAWKKVYGSIAP